MLRGRQFAGDTVKREPLMLDEDIEIQLQDLATDEIRELLLEAGAEISLAQAEQLATFVAQAGSLDEAVALLTRLGERRDAA